MKIRVGFARSAAEGAELASHKADVREIDIAVDHVADDIAGQVAPQRVRCYEQCKQVVTLATGQSVALAVVETCPVLLFQHALQGAANRQGGFGRNKVPGQRGELLKFCSLPSITLSYRPAAQARTPPPPIRICHPE